MCNTCVSDNLKMRLVGRNKQQISTVGEGVLIVLAWPKQLKHPHPQNLFVVNSNTVYTVDIC